MKQENYWKIAVFILIVILAWKWTDNNDDYEFCIDNCVFNNVDCTYTYRIYDEATNDFVSRGESIICLENLKSCVEECER